MNFLLLQTLKFSKDLVQVERNGYVFQIDSSPFSSCVYMPGGGGPPPQVIGHKYFLGMHMIVGHGNMDAVEKIRVGEKVVWESLTNGTAPNRTITINQPNIFGGDRKEGGISGDVDLMFGDITQTQNSYLTSRLGYDIPAFRGLMSFVLNQVYIGTSPYLKPWSFFCKRVNKQINGDNQWYAAKAIIRAGEEAGDDLNAAHIIRECLIDKEWGLGWNATDDIDDTFFRNTADILYDEGFGLSMLWDFTISVEDFIDEILNYISGILYQDLETGKWCLALTREPTEVELSNAETFNEDDIISVDEFARPSYGEIINTVTVNWWDKLAHKSRPAEANDIALIEKEGNVIIEKVLNYQGICNATLANQVAERELKLASSMLAGLRLKCTRRMSHLKPNSIFKLSWADLDITEMVIRVLNVNYGNLDKNEVTLVCVEDSFSTAETIYGDAPDSLWSDSISSALDVTNRRLIEIPHWLLCNDMIGSLSLVTALDNDVGYLIVAAEKPTIDAFDYDIIARLSALFEFKDIGLGNCPFTPTGVFTVSLAMNAEDATIDLSSESDLDLVEDNTFAIVDEEIIKIISVDTTNNRVTIARGILDTVPAAHSSGARIYFMQLKYGGIDVEYTNDDTPSTKLLTRTAKGSLAPGDATIEIADVLDSRMIRPYPPGNLKFNGISYPNYISSGAYGNKIAITWNHRDRTDVTQLNSLVKHTDSIDYGPEAGTTYSIKIYGEGDIEGINSPYDKDTFDSPNGPATPFNYTEAMEILDFGSLQERLRFVIYAVRNGYNSWKDGYNILLRRSFRVGTDPDSKCAGISEVTGRLSTYFDGSSHIDAVSSASGSLTVIPPEYDLFENSTWAWDGQVRSVYGSAFWFAQTFTPQITHAITSVILSLGRPSGDAPGIVTVSIRATDENGKPTGDDLCFGTTDGDTVPEIDWPTPIPEEREITFSTNPILDADTKYAIVVRAPSGSSSNKLYWSAAVTSVYENGDQCQSDNAGLTWVLYDDRELWFEEFGYEWG